MHFIRIADDKDLPVPFHSTLGKISHQLTNSLRFDNAIHRSYNRHIRKILSFNQPTGATATTRPDPLPILTKEALGQGQGHRKAGKIPRKQIGMVESSSFQNMLKNLCKLGLGLA